MQTFILLTRLAHGSLRSPDTLEKLERRIKDRMTEEFGETGVEWVANYAVLGPYDYVDIFRAADVEAAMKVSTIIRTFGHAHTEVWPAMDWQRFKAIVRELPAGNS